MIFVVLYLAVFKQALLFRKAIFSVVQLLTFCQVGTITTHWKSYAAGLFFFSFFFQIVGCSETHPNLTSLGEYYTWVCSYLYRAASCLSGHRGSVSRLYSHVLRSRYSPPLNRKRRKLTLQHPKLLLVSLSLDLLK